MYWPEYVEQAGMKDKRVEKLMKIKKGGKNMSGADAYSLITEMVFVESIGSDDLADESDMYEVFELVLNDIRSKRYLVDTASLKRIIIKAKKNIRGTSKNV